MKRKDWFIKYTLEFIVIVLGISVSFGLIRYQQTSKIIMKELKVLNSLQKEAKEINYYCERERQTGKMILQY